jgi:hypothetical protein
MLFVANLVSCTKKEYITIAPEVETDQSTYTIMMYGCGGGNLDSAMVLNIQEALLAGASDRVNFVGQIKFSQVYQSEEVLAGTQRFIVGEAGEQWYEPVEVLDTNLALYDPQNLTEFINWAKEQRPADKYILLLWNHGSAWRPNDDYYEQESRAIVHDDIHNSVGLSLDNLVKGVKDSDTKFQMIYFDACLMGMVEVLSGLNECTEYTMCASHITPGLGGDYNSLIHHLNNSTNFEDAMKAYIRETVAHWDVQSMPLDLMLVDNSKMDAVLSEIKVLSGYMKEVAQIFYDYQSGVYDKNDANISSVCASYQRAISMCYHYDTSYDENHLAEYPFYDLHTFVEILANGYLSTYSAKFVDISSRLNRVMSDAIVYKQVTSALSGSDLSMGITIVDLEHWETFGYKEAYDKLAFQQKTGWGDWLEINLVRPYGNPNPDTIMQNGEENPEQPGEEPGEEQQPAADVLIDFILTLIGKK